MTGSSLTLGTAGSRRTVYLIDDKLPDTQNLTTSSSSKKSTTSPDENALKTDNTMPQQQQPQQPQSTFLMFNRISNVIGGNKTVEDNSSVPLSKTASLNDVDKKDKKKGGGSNDGPPDDGKESAIWYEYGCV